MYLTYGGVRARRPTKFYRKTLRRGDPCGRPPVLCCTHGRAHGPCPTSCCVIGSGRTGSSAPTRFYRKMVRRGRCLHRPGGTDFQIVRRAACPHAAAGAVVIARRAEGSPPYGFLSVNGPIRSCTVHTASRTGPALQKSYCRAAPMCAAAHRTPYKVSLRGRAAPAVMPPAAPLLSAAKEREERAPSKPMVLKFFSRLECRLCRFSFATRMKTAKFRALLSQRLCV